MAETPPPFWKNTIKKQIFFVGWLPLPEEPEADASGQVRGVVNVVMKRFYLLHLGGRGQDQGQEQVKKAEQVRG